MKKNKVENCSYLKTHFNNIHRAKLAIAEVMSWHLIRIESNKYDYMLFVAIHNNV